MSKELIEQLAKKIQALPRYSFLLNESGGVKRWANASGDWIDRYEVVTMIDNAFEAYQAAAPIDNVAEALSKAIHSLTFIASITEEEKTEHDRSWNDSRFRNLLGLRMYRNQVWQTANSGLAAIRALIPDTQANKEGE
jgi:hypothetical protein